MKNSRAESGGTDRGGQALSFAQGIPRIQRSKPAKSLDAYLKHREGRDAGILQAVRVGQYSLTAIANALGLSVSRVSRIVAARGKAKGKA